MPWKFHDDISNGSGVIVLTNRQSQQTDMTENNTTSMSGKIQSSENIIGIETSQHGD